MRYLLLVTALLVTVVPAPPRRRRPGRIPPEYDQPFNGEVIDYVAKDMDEITAICANKRALGCAKTAAATADRAAICYVYLAHPIDMLRHGGTSEEVRRHEMAHCNGWPGDHPTAEQLKERRERIAQQRQERDYQREYQTRLEKKTKDEAEECKCSKPPCVRTVPFKCYNPLTDALDFGATKKRERICHFATAIVPCAPAMTQTTNPR